MKYLITGGCGFLGSNLSNEALKRKEELFVFDNLSRLGSEQNLEWLREKGEFTFIKGDTRKMEDIEDAVRKYQPDVIIHLAGQVAMTTSIEDPRKDFEINALGSFNVLESVRLHSPDTVVVYSSTNKVYGDLEWVNYIENETRYVSPEYKDGLPEEIPLSFSSPYGCSKGCADQYMLDYNRMFNIKTVVLRHSSMYGGRQFATYDQGWIGWFCQKAIEIKTGTLKEDFTISGNGKQVRDLLHADDMVSLYFKVIDNAEKLRGQAFNIGGGMNNSLSLLELFSLLENKLNIKIKYTKIEKRHSDQNIFVADLKKISTYIDWKPLVDKSDGIDKMLQWIKSYNK